MFTVFPLLLVPDIDVTLGVIIWVMDDGTWDDGKFWRDNGIWKD